MLQRILGGVLVLLGLATAALGVASATVWRDSDTVVATAEPAGDGTMVVTDPGVLGLVSGDVTVSAKAPDGQPVTLVVGRDVDVLGWVGDEPYSRVTGLQDWDTLGVEAGTAAGAEAEGGADENADEKAAPSGADPAGNDMWVAETSEDGSATLRWSDRPGRWTLLAAGVGKDAQAPTLELTWPRAVATPYLWPAVGAGAVLVVLGGLLFVLGTRRARARRADAPRGNRAEPGLGTATDEPGAVPGEGPGDVPGDEAPSAGTTPFAPVHGSAPWSRDVVPGTPDRATDASAHPVEATTPDAGTAPSDDEPDPDHPSGSGTAEVPMAGRLLRRSRRRSAPEAPAAPAAPVEPAAAPAGFWSPAEAAPVAPAEAAAEPADPAPRPGTGAMPYLSRRELRAREEARRAAEQGGVSRMLRSITGSIPAVRQQEPAAPTAPAAEPAPDHDLSTRAGRAAAWRATWGFGQSAGDSDHDRTTDGENR